MGECRYSFTILDLGPAALILIKCYKYILKGGWMGPRTGLEAVK
jgi:hypothetical protein